jgi:hypothetical protein
VAVQGDNRSGYRASGVGDSQSRMKSPSRRIALILYTREPFLLQRQLDPAIPQQRSRGVVAIVHAQHHAHLATPFFSI